MVYDNLEPDKSSWTFKKVSCTKCNILVDMEYCDICAYKQLNNFDFIQSTNKIIEYYIKQHMVNYGCIADFDEDDLFV